MLNQTDLPYVRFRKEKLMRPLFSILLAVLLGACQFTPTPTTTATPTTSPTIEPESTLTPTPYVGPHTAVYFGGSITCGSVTSDKNHRWWVITSKWLDEAYPQVQWTHVNSCAPGTPSWYGLVRLDKEVISHQPELVFIDFAVNDTAADTMGLAPAAEALIRKLRTALPNAKLVAMIFTWPDGYSYLTPIRSAPRDEWIKLANHYDIQLIRLDEAIASKLGGTVTDAGVEQYYAGSPNVHPNDAGHALIAETIASQLTDLGPSWSGNLPDYTYVYTNTVPFEAAPIIRPGPDNNGASGAWTDDGVSITSTEAGAELQWSGTFSSFGLETNVREGAGVLAWSIDGGPFKNIDLSQRGARIYPVWAGPTGQHSVTIRVISGQVIIYRFMAI